MTRTAAGAAPASPSAPPAPVPPEAGERPTVKLLNAWVHDITMEELVEEFDRGMLLTLHVDMIMKLQKDREFHAILDQFDVITCDSQILYFATRFLGTPVRGRVSGSDFFPLYCERHKNDEDVRIFICGGKPGIAEIARDRINERAGRELVVEVCAPPFDFDTNPEETDRIVEAVNASGATVLLVGLGGGRQEKFIVANRHRFENIHTFLPLGGTIDYEAGTFRRPPAWVTEWGLEWLYRLVKEPRQRWHRYVVHEPPVIPLLLRQKLGLYRDPHAS